MKEKHKRFVEVYIETLNATEAYRQAYGVVNDRTAETNGCRLLRRAEVQAYIKNIMDAKDKERIMSMDEILERQTRIARGEEYEEVIVPLYKKYEIVKKKPSIKDQQKSMEHLAKLQGFGDNVNHTGSVVFKFESDYGDNEEDPL